MIKLILINDYCLIRQGICALLSAADDLHVQAGATLNDVQEALAACQVVILSVRQLNLTCFDQVQTLKLTAPHLAIIVMAASNDERAISRILSMGALGYLGFDATGTELLAAIHKVVLGLRYVPAVLARKLMLKQMLSPSISMDNNPFLLLALREKQCAAFLAQGKKTLEISALMAISTQSVNSYRYRIFQKLQVSGEVALIKLALRHQLIADTSDAN